MLERIQKENDIKNLDAQELSVLAEEIREFLVEKVSRTGGHLASNLGVVELTMALHLTFELPKDKIVWDVGHQAYTHKILTGRKEGFDNLRKYGGMSGFPKRKESLCDAFDTGHSSTSISAGLGLVEARELKGEDYRVVAVIGDGSLTGGMAYEALNNASHLKKNFIIILNDNNMSISENVGGMSKYLSDVRTAGFYTGLKKGVTNALEKVPVAGDRMIKQIQKTKSSIKQLIVPGMFFEDMGITYLGPVPGHNIQMLCKALKDAKRVDGPVLVHVLTEKGKGYEPAEKAPGKFHGVAPFDVQSGEMLEKKKSDTYTDVFGKVLCAEAAKNPAVVAITAAMSDGTGLSQFARRFPRRFFDVGIAEGHAVTFAAGLAAGGMKPVFAVYSSFLQRGYDQLIHDVGLQNLPVVFAVDRAGLVGSDGETHQGVFDIAYLRSIPNMTIMTPSDENECRKMLTTAFKMDTPAAVRYPRGKGPGVLQDEALETLEIGKARVIRESAKQNKRVAILAFGLMVSRMREVAEKLDATLVDMRFVKPLDREILVQVAATHDLLCTVEDGVAAGGAGGGVLEALSEMGMDVPVLVLGIKDRFIPQGTIDELMRENELDTSSVLRRIEEALLIRSFVDLKPHNTMAVSAKARYFAEVTDRRELELVLDFARRENIEPFILGGGSNLLIASHLVNRLVIKMNMKGFEARTDEKIVKVGAGESWHETVRRVLDLGWGGPENLALIPGTVGGAVVQNIGAYGAEVAQFVRSVEVFDPQTSLVRTLTNEECDFGYRHSVFKTQAGSKWIVLAVELAFDSQWSANLSYKELALGFKDSQETTPQAIFEAVVAARSRKLPDPKVLPSAGSFFKNPVVTREVFQQLLEQFPSIVHYPLSGGREKLAAGWLIDQAGLKGVRHGFAGTYEKQALVLVNHDGAADGQALLDFASFVQDRVEEKFGVRLEPEPVVLK